MSESTITIGELFKNPDHTRIVLSVNGQQKKYTIANFKELVRNGVRFPEQMELLSFDTSEPEPERVYPMNYHLL